jgi:hypothetical protein
MKLRTFIVCLAPLISHAHTQAASEIAASSVIGANSAEAKPPLSLAPAESHPNGSAHLNAGASPTTATSNRQILEMKAGQDAAKLLLRSEPSGAHVWIDGLFIGKTPVLLFLAPGKHRMEIHGPRQKFALRILEISPREISDLVVKLTVRYPTNVIVR